MFGHSDEQNNDQNNVSTDSIGVMPPVVPDPSVTAGLTTGASSAPSFSPSANDTPSAPNVPNVPSVVTPTDSDSPTDSESPAPVSQNDEETETDQSSDNSSVSSSSSDESSNESASGDASEDATPAGAELMNLKQQALQQLSPLVGHLDQTPEEKFRTTMMMIQASDDSTLVKTAFEAAQEITDDKTRAQALLDVINEINYFTQHEKS